MECILLKRMQLSCTAGLSVDGDRQEIYRFSQKHESLSLHDVDYFFFYKEPKIRFMNSSKNMEHYIK